MFCLQKTLILEKVNAIFLDIEKKFEKVAKKLLNMLISAFFEHLFHENRTLPYQVILAGTLTGVQGDIRCKVLAALSTVK